VYDRLRNSLLNQNAIAGQYTTQTGIEARQNARFFNEWLQSINRLISTRLPIAPRESGNITQGLSLPRESWNSIRGTFYQAAYSASDYLRFRVQTTYPRTLNLRLQDWILTTRNPHLFSNMACRLWGEPPVQNSVLFNLLRESARNRRCQYLCWDNHSDDIPKIGLS
jgi:hypothetical protein